MFAAYLRTFDRLGLTCHSHARRHRSRSAAISAMNSSFSPRPARSEVLLPQGFRQFRYPAGRYRFRRCRRPEGDLRQVDRLLYAATVGDARRGSIQRHPGGRAPFGARHRGRPHLLFRHQIFRADGRQGAGARRQGAHRSHGLLRHRRRRALFRAIIEAIA